MRKTVDLSGLCITEMAKCFLEGKWLRRRIALKILVRRAIPLEGSKRKALLKIKTRPFEEFNVGADFGGSDDVIEWKRSLVWM